MATFREKLELLIDANVQGFVGAMDKAGAAADKNLGKETTGKIDQLAGKFTVMGAAAVGGASVAAIGLGKLAQLAGEAQVAQAKLDNSIANSSQKFSDNGKAVSDLAGELQKKVVADDESIRSGQAVLVQFGLTERQVMSLTPLIVDLSRKMGVDLETAAKAVGKSATGTSGALKKMGIDVASLGEGSTDAEKTISALQKSVGGFARAEGATFSGQLAILKNQLSELGESVGMGAAGTLQSIVGSANGLASALNDVNPGITAAVGSFATLATIGVGGLGALSFAAGQFISMRDNLPQLTAGLRDAEGNLTRFGTAAANLGRLAIGVGIVAGVIEIGNQFNKASQDATKFQNALNTLNGSVGGSNIKATADLYSSLVGSVDRYAQSADAAAKAQGANAFGPLNAVQTGLAGLLNQNSDLYSEVIVKGEKFRLDLNQTGEAIDKLRESNSPTATKGFLDGLMSSTTNNRESALARAEAIAQATDLYNAQIKSAAGSQSAAVAAQQDAAAARDAGVATGEYAATAADLKDKSDELTLSQKRLSAQYDVSQASAKGFASALGFVTNNAGQAIDSAQAVGKAVQDVFRPTKGSDGEEVAAVIRSLPPEFDAARAAIGGYSDEQNKAIDGLQQYGAAAQANLAALLSTGATTQQVQDAASGYAEFIRSQLIPAFEAQGLSSDDAKAKAEGYILQLGLTPDQVNTQIVLGGVEAARQQLQFLQGDFDNIPDTVRKEIYAAVRRGEWDEALRIYNQFKDKGVVITVDVKQIGSFLAGQTPGVFGVKLPARAAGGPVTKDKTYLVGEKGPELFTAPMTGAITPNDTLRQLVAPSSSTVNNTGPSFSVGAINITEASDGTGTARDVVRKMRDLAYLGG